MRAQEYRPSSQPSRRRLTAYVASILTATAAMAGVVEIEPESPLERHVKREHLHSLDLVTLEQWSQLADAGCSPSEPTTRALVIGIGEYANPRILKLQTDQDVEFVQAALKARGVARQQMRVLRDAEATHAVIVAELTRLLAESTCGDRIVLTWSGNGVLSDSRNLGPHAGPGHLPEPVSIMPAHDAVGLCSDSATCTGYFTSHDLVDFVTAARNRGVEVLLLLDSCHGTDMAGAGRERVWELPLGSGRPFNLHPDAADFTALFAAQPDSQALEVPGPGGLLMGAFTLAVTTALQDPAVRTPRALGPRVVATLAKVAPGQVPMIQASDPDKSLFGGALGAGTRGLGAELEITAPDATRGLVLVSENELRVAGQLRPSQGLVAVFVDGKPAELSRDGRFEARIELASGENLVMVSGWYSDHSNKTRSFTVARREDATAALQQGKLYALLIGVQDYDDPDIRDLETPLADIEILARVLTTRYGFQTFLEGDELPDTLVLRNPTRREIVRALERLVRSTREPDRVLVYFAGHSAVPEGLEQAYWLPRDALQADITDWIEADRVRTTIKRMAARSVLVVSDSCYSAALSREAGKEETRPEDVGERDRYLLRMESQRSRFLIASGNLEPVADGGGSGHSIFARALLEQLERPAHPRFTSSELFAPIVEKVAGNSRQEPQRTYFRDSGHDGGDFVFSEGGG